MKLILPNTEHMISFFQMAHGLQSEGHWWGPNLSDIQNDFPAYLHQLLLARSDLVADQIPKTEFWILKNEAVIGRLNLNHRLSEAMKIRGGHIGYGISKPFRNKGFASSALAATLTIAKEKGIKEVLMTCDDDNLGSIRVIEKNGGVFKDKVMAPKRTILTRRYLIPLIEE